MGLFDKFKKKAEPAPAFPLILEASAKGQAVEMADIPDAVFSSGALGPCRGVKPSEGAIYAPVDGTVSNLDPRGCGYGGHERRRLQGLRQKR